MSLVDHLRREYDTVTVGRDPGSCGSSSRHGSTPPLAPPAAAGRLLASAAVAIPPLTSPASGSVRPAAPRRRFDEKMLIAMVILLAAAGSVVGLRCRQSGLPHPLVWKTRPRGSARSSFPPGTARTPGPTAHISAVCR